MNSCECTAGNCQCNTRAKALSYFLQGLSHGLHGLLDESIKFEKHSDNAYSIYNYKLGFI